MVSLKRFSVKLILIDGFLHMFIHLSLNYAYLFTKYITSFIVILHLP